MAKATTIRSVATGLVVAAALSGLAFGAPGSSHAATPSALDSFGGTTPAAVTTHTIKPLYRERTTATTFRLHRVPCASAAMGDSSTCFAAR